jgi:hypothetical protein
MPEAGHDATPLGAVPEGRTNPIWHVPPGAESLGCQTEPSPGRAAHPASGQWLRSLAGSPVPAGQWPSTGGATGQQLHSVTAVLLLPGSGAPGSSIAAASGSEAGPATATAMRSRYDVPVGVVQFDGGVAPSSLMELRPFAMSEEAHGHLFRPLGHQVRCWAF